ncbi:MAG: metal-dependent hydrolase [Candidatus Njordarchaeia archaeon]
MGYIRFLGHSAFEIEVSGKKILIDPWLENPQSPVKPEQIDRVDYIIVTHDHGDHLGNAFDIAKKTGATIVGIYEIALLANQNGVEKAIGGNIGGPMKLDDDVTVILTPAFHSCEKGSPTGVVILTKEGALYHAGDTGVFGDMNLIYELYKPKIAMLPIGGHFVMGPKEAAKAVELLKPEVVIPMHYATFPVLKGTPEEFEKYVKEKGLTTKILALKPGEKYEF